MSISKELLSHLEERLISVMNQRISISSYSAVGGGSINFAYCLQYDRGKLMIKLNSKHACPDMFKCESEGLAIIRHTQTIAVPDVILHGEYKDMVYLVMEWIDNRRPTPEASQLLGQQLAAMHSHASDRFGLAADNYMGSLRQSNKQHTSWSRFFIEERLQPMVRLAVDKRLLNHQDAQQFEKLYRRLDQLFDEEQPALIHGDLWGGNYLTSTDHRPYLIDPAICYGHREFDLAMTTLFGGFSEEFYNAYHESYPLDKTWHTRIDLWNLYPLLIHLNLFGVGYLEQVREALQFYS